MVFLNGDDLHVEDMVRPSNAQPSSCYGMSLSSDWDRHYLELDTLGRYFLANLPYDTLGEALYNEWPKLARALHQMTRETFFDFCGDVGEEICRRNNNLRDGVLCLPSFDNVPLGRNYTRQKLSSLSSESFHNLCLRTCFEIGKRSPRITKLRQSRKSSLHIDSYIEAYTSSLSSEPRTFLDENTANYSAKELSRLLDNLYTGEPLLDDFCSFQDPYCADISQNPFSSTISAIYSVFVSILHDREQSTVILSSQGDAAQKLLDLMQMLLDYPKADPVAKGSILSALLRLSGNSGLHPRCFLLTGVKLGKSMVVAGAFGDIWKGELQGQQVCMKIIRIYQSTAKNSWLKAFSREAIIWGQISHPNILPFYGVYHLDDEHQRLCLVSSWMNRGNLNEYLLDVPNADRLLLALDIASGLAYLHEQDIVHGDLKGANILVTDAGRACLSDFGLSAIRSPDMFSHLTPKSSGIHGTIRWLAPELLSTEDEHPRVTAESDVYAYGCVLYEVYTGNYPFYEVARDFTVILRILEGKKPTRPHPSSSAFLQFKLSEAIWSIMECCWKTRPSERPAIHRIISKIHEQGIIDTRCVDNWEKNSASRFRNGIYRNDSLSLSVLETVLSWL